MFQDTANPNTAAATATDTAADATPKATHTAATLFGPGVRDVRA